MRGHTLSTLTVMLIALGTAASAMEEPPETPPAGRASGATGSSCTPGASSPSISSSSGSPRDAAALIAALRSDIAHPGGAGPAMFLGVDEGEILGDLDAINVQAPVYTRLVDRRGGPSLDAMGRPLIGPHSRVGTRELQAPHPDGLVIMYSRRHYFVARPAREGDAAERVLATAEGMGYVPLTRSAIDDLGRPTEVEIIPGNGHCLISTLYYLSHGSLPEAHQIEDFRAEVARRMADGRLLALAQEIIQDTHRTVRPRADDTGCYAGLGPALSRYLDNDPTFLDVYSAALARGLATQEAALGACRAPVPPPAADGAPGPGPADAGARQGGRSGAPELGPLGFRYAGSDWSWRLDNEGGGNSRMEMTVQQLQARAVCDGRGIASLELTRGGISTAFPPTQAGAAEWLRQFGAMAERFSPGCGSLLDDQLNKLSIGLTLHHIAGLSNEGRERERAGTILRYLATAQSNYGLDSLENLQRFMKEYRESDPARLAPDPASGAMPVRAAGGWHEGLAQSRTTFNLATLLGARTGAVMGPISLGRPTPMADSPLCLVSTTTPGAAHQYLGCLDTSWDAALGDPLLSGCQLGPDPIEATGWIYPGMILAVSDRTIRLFAVGAEQEFKHHGDVPVRLTAPLGDLAMNPINPAQLVTADGNNLRFFDLEHPAAYRRLRQPGAAITSVTWPGGRVNQGACPSMTTEDGRYRIWDARAMPVTPQLFNCTLAQAGLNTHARGTDHTTYLGFENGEIWLIDARVTDRILGKVQGSRTEPVRYLDFDDERNALLAGGPASWATFTPVQTGEPLPLEFSMACPPAPAGAAPEFTLALPGRPGSVLDLSSAGLLGLTRLNPRPPAP